MAPAGERGVGATRRPPSTREVVVDITANRIETDVDRQPHHGRTSPPCARTRPDPLLCGADSSSSVSAAAIVIAAQSSEAEIITAETTLH